MLPFAIHLINCAKTNIVEAYRRARNIGSPLMAARIDSLWRQPAALYLLYDEPCYAFCQVNSDEACQAMVGRLPAPIANRNQKQMAELIHEMDAHCSFTPAQAAKLKAAAIGDSARLLRQIRILTNTRFELSKASDEEISRLLTLLDSVNTAIEQGVLVKQSLFTTVCLTTLSEKQNLLLRRAYLKPFMRILESIPEIPQVDRVRLEQKLENAKVDTFELRNNVLRQTRLAFEIGTDELRCIPEYKILHAHLRLNLKLLPTRCFAEFPPRCVRVTVTSEMEPAKLQLSVRETP